MNLLDRYIAKSVMFSILSVLGVIGGLAMLFAFIDELGDIEGGYGLSDALVYVLLTAPRRFYDLLPMAALIGCLVGLGTLASSSELTVMRAAGVSVGRIVGSVMKPLLVLMIAGLVLGEYLAPAAESLAQSRRAMAQDGGLAQSSRHGVWHRQGEEYVHINAVQSGGVLYGITRYRFDDQRRMLSSSFARRAVYDVDHWQLENVATTRFLEGSTQVDEVPSERWDIELTPDLLSTVSVDPEALSISGLWRYVHYLAAQELSNGRYWLAFWTKVLQPVVSAALVLMAISFIFGPLRSVTLGQRIFTGVLVGFVFSIAQQLLGPSSLVFGFPPLVAVLLPAAICALAGAWLLRRAG